MPGCSAYNCPLANDHIKIHNGSIMNNILCFIPLNDLTSNIRFSTEQHPMSDIIISNKEIDNHESSFSNLEFYIKCDYDLKHIRNAKYIAEILIPDDANVCFKIFSNSTDKMIIKKIWLGYEFITYFELDKIINEELYVKELENCTFDRCKELVISHPKLYKYVKDCMKKQFSQTMLKNIANKHPTIIYHMNDPTPKICKIVVKQSPILLDYIKENIETFITSDNIKLVMTELEQVAVRNT